MDSFKSSALHTLEFAAVLGIAYLALTVFGVSSELVRDAVATVLAFAVKYVRDSNQGICKKVPDYVNK